MESTTPGVFARAMECRYEHANQTSVDSQLSPEHPLLDGMGLPSGVTVEEVVVVDVVVQRCAGIDGDIHGFAVDRQARHFFLPGSRAGNLVGPTRDLSLLGSSLAQATLCHKQAAITRRARIRPVDGCPL